MFAAAQKAKIIEWRMYGKVKIGVIPSESLPESFTLSQLHGNLCTSDASNSEESSLRNILVLSVCLYNPDRLSRESGDDEQIHKISLWLSRAMLPSPSLIPESAKPISDSALKVTHQKGIAGLLLFQAKPFNLDTSSPKRLDPQILISFIAFSSATDPWATSSSISIANDLLLKYEHQTHTSSFIIDDLLQQFIRPIFSKAKRSEAITASGRKAMPSSAPPRRFDSAASDPINLPWLYEAPYAITVFDWAVRNSSTEIAARSFNLYLPPLLALLDNPVTAIRSRALGILNNFLPLLPPKLLVQTGLAEVFEDAVTPTLMFLPNLTPANESVLLLEGAYGCLVELGSVLYGAKEDEKEGRGGMEGKEKEMKYWDRLMRKGVLTGYEHSSEYPEIAEVLVQSMGKLVEKMGVHAVKHLKDVLPILSATLSDPFASSHPALLLTTLGALQKVVSSCWPRLSEPHHRVELISALTLCWKSVSHTEERVDEPLEEVKAQLCVAGTMLVRAVEGDEGMDLRKELSPLFDVDPSLREVFRIDEKEST